MKPKHDVLFYYLNGVKGRHGAPKSNDMKHQKGDPIIAPIVTVCLIKTADGKYCRGVAICSDKESGSRSSGRKLSLMRAIKALQKEMSSEQCSNKPFIIAANADIYWQFVSVVGETESYKSQYDIQPTTKELRMLQKRDLEPLVKQMPPQIQSIDIPTGKHQECQQAA